jgi:hypothetical protein
MKHVKGKSKIKQRKNNGKEVNIPYDVKKKIENKHELKKKRNKVGKKKKFE